VSPTELASEGSLGERRLSPSPAGTSGIEERARGSHPLAGQTGSCLLPKWDWLKSVALMVFGE